MMSKAMGERTTRALAEWRATLKDDGTCWQCSHQLGMGPYRCLTCAAKRAEERAKR